MRTVNQCRSIFVFVLTSIVCLLSIACGGSSSTSGPAGNGTERADDGTYDEAQLASEVFDQLKGKRSLVEASPMYDPLKPIVDPITRTVQPKYEYPLRFYLIHDPSANAFTASGGNIYITDELLYATKTNDELAGVICHEVAHAVNHDSVELMQKREENWRRGIAAEVLLGRTRGKALAILFLGHLNSLGYSREVEERADLDGADICAEAGHNPWGLIWFFRDYDVAGKEELPEVLSDHPDHKSRTESLEKHFRRNASKFEKFNSDRRSATAFSVPDKAPVVFMR
ncbi:MAG: M48 family metallopeptidase [Pyrinomonadaceae bacterium]